MKGPSLPVAPPVAIQPPAFLEDEDCGVLEDWDSFDLEALKKDWRIN